MDPIRNLLADVARARKSGVNFGDERSKVDAVLDSFRKRYECVTVRSLGGSLEIGRPFGNGHQYWVCQEGAEALPAIMLKRAKPAVPEAAEALLNALATGKNPAAEKHALAQALSQLGHE